MTTQAKAPRGLGAGGRVPPMVFRHRIGWLALAVLPMLVAGAFAFVAGVRHQWYNHESIKPGSGWALMGMGLFTFTVSLALICMVWDVRIDRAGNRVTRRRGTLGWVRSHSTPLDAFNGVAVMKGMVQGYARYRIYLSGPSAAEYLTEYTYVEQAHEKAAEVRRYLGFPDGDNDNDNDTSSR